MDSKIAIVADTSSDIPKDIAKKYNITVLNAYVNFGIETFTADDITMDEFHERTEKSNKQTFPKTSQASAQDFMEAYERLKGEGAHVILSIHVSGKLSGTINSANVAAGMLDGIDIRVIDSHSATFPVTAMLIKAGEMVKDNKNVDEIVSELERFSKSLAAYASLRTLDNLVRGGRMGQVRYRFGKWLNVKPIILIGNDAIKSIGKARGTQKSIERAFELAIDGKKNSKNLRYIIGHADLAESAHLYEKKLKEQFGEVKGIIAEIGMAIAVHAGRGAILFLVYND